MKKSVFVALLSVLAIWPVLASAETTKRSVPAGKSTVVHGLYYYNRGDCTVAPNPQARIRRQPKHGKASIKIFREKLPKTGVSCPGMTVSGPMVVYTPKRGYGGADELSVSYQTNAFEASARLIERRVTVKITVK